MIERNFRRRGGNVSLKGRPSITPYKERLARAPKEITCERCGIEFLHNKSGKRKYCIECQDIVQDEHMLALKEKKNETKDA